VGGGVRGGGTTDICAAGNLLSLALSSHVEERGRADAADEPAPI
jgi:hypothetical protein